MKIYKYRLDNERGHFILRVPTGSRPLCVRIQDDAPIMYIELSDSQVNENMEFIAIHTGDEFDAKDDVYVGTYELFGVVYHIYRLDD